MFFLELFVLLNLLVLSLAVAYLYLLAAVGFVGRKRRRDLDPSWRYLVLIPAHNEEKQIQGTLEGLDRLLNREAAKIVVVADNCEDGTADAVKTCGFTVLERDDPSRRGKGYALQWALERSALEEFDAVVVIDADTQVRPDLLAAVSRSLQSGAGAVQCCNELSAENGTPLAHLHHMANAVENHLFYKPRARLGLPILLRGTGMAFRVSVLREHPWDSHSVTEDVDYSVRLLIAGVSIDFTDESSVVSAASGSYGQAYDQKLRWASGTFSMIRERFLPLLRASIRARRPALAELACSFLLLSRPALMYWTVIPLVLALFLPGDQGVRYVLWALGIEILLVVYLLSGILVVSDKKGALRSLPHAPVFALWQLLVQARALRKGKRLRWVRTRRDDEK
jgi:1,2-diacylglycerol 3-beta-glucosyltransferase